MSASSCSVQKSSAHHVFFPSEEVITMKSLAKDLSKETGFALSEDEDDLGLYAFVVDWRGVPYRYGSVGMNGTDCSGFVMKLYEEVYNISLGRTSAAGLMSKTHQVKRNNLKEGDLVFFNIRNRCGGAASHVGVYLKDNKFVHASTSSGVIISSLNEPYYKRTYIGGGPVK